MSPASYKFVEFMGSPQRKRRDDKTLSFVFNLHRETSRAKAIELPRWLSTTPAQF